VRTPLIAANWKMHKTVGEAEEFIAALLPQVAAADGVEIAVCPSFLALQPLVDSARGSRVAIYAQNNVGGGEVIVSISNEDMERDDVGDDIYVDIEQD